MLINRVWAMPNKNTFTIKPIRALIDSRACNWVDPFPDPYRMDAIEYLKTFADNSCEGVLFDPPYSPRQLKECYNNQGMALHDTKLSVWKGWREEIARVVKPGGIVISFGWSTNGIGIKRGFKIEEILIVAHGSNHNDTLCTVERKCQ